MKMLEKLKTNREVNQNTKSNNDILKNFTSNERFGWMVKRDAQWDAQNAKNLDKNYSSSFSWQQKGCTVGVIKYAHTSCMGTVCMLKSVDKIVYGKKVWYPIAVFQKSTQFFRHSILLRK